MLTHKRSALFAHAIGALAYALLFGLAGPAHAQATFSADFFDARGNEWWVEIDLVASEEVALVEARVDEGEWRTLPPTSWGSWASSFFVPSGSLVDFRATGVSGATALSGRYEWPSATLIAPPPDDDDGGGEAPPVDDGGGLTASFDNPRGNEWWVEIEVSAAEELANVQARVDEGPWQSLSPTGWASWAASFFVPSGSLVDFRATSTSGATARSGLYEWPSATQVAPPPDDDDGGGEDPPIDDGDDDPPADDEGDLSASFDDVRGNDWWVEVEVSAAEELAAVHARVDEGPWQALSPTGWGSWAASFFVPSGSLVDFRATSTSGATARSGLYEWPSGTPVTSPPGGDDGGDDDPPPPPSGDADVAILVDAMSGPGGSGSFVQIRDNALGTSVADWEPQWYRGTPDAQFQAYLQGLQPSFLRWPAGHSSQNYAFVRTPGTSGMREITADHVVDFMDFAGSVGAEVVIGINVKTQPPENAADLVRFLNVDNDYNVTWFHLGNEPDHTDGLTASPQVHVERHLDTAAAMRAVDPNIRIVGGEIMTGAGALGLHGMTNWLSPLLEQASDTMEAASWHWYQLDSGQGNTSSSAYMTLEALFQETAADWNPASINVAAQIMPELRQQAPGMPIWITEYGEDPGPAAGAGLADTMAGAVWAADSLGRYLREGTDVILKWVFKQSGSALSFLADDNTPRPEYLAWWLYNREFGDEVVDAQSSSLTEVNAHAAWRSDGGLAVMLSNKTASWQTVGVELEGFTPTSAVRYVIRGSFDGYDATSATLNGQALTPERAVSGVAGEPVPSEELLNVQMAPVSVMLIVYE